MHGGGEYGSAAAKRTGRLTWALGLTAAYMFAEIVGGLLTGSLALLADAAHMLTDVAGLALALIAIRFAAREPTAKLTYGYLRLEVLSALTNAVVLLLLTVYIVYEAYQRFLAPPEVLSGPMLAVAVVGLVVNLVSMRLPRRVEGLAPGRSDRRCGHRSVHRAAHLDSSEAGHRHPDGRNARSHRRGRDAEKVAVFTGRAGRA